MAATYNLLKVSRDGKDYFFYISSDLFEKNQSDPNFLDQLAQDAASSKNPKEWGFEKLTFKNLARQTVASVFVELCVSGNVKTDAKLASRILTALKNTSLPEEALSTEPATEVDAKSVVHTPKNTFNFNNEITETLLELYENYISQVGPNGRFPKNKHMWETIACEINAKHDTDLTGEQCNNRYKTVQRRKRNVEQKSLLSSGSLLTQQDISHQEPWETVELEYVSVPAQSQLVTRDAISDTSTPKSADAAGVLELPSTRKRRHSGNNDLVDVVTKYLKQQAANKNEWHVREETRRVAKEQRNEARHNEKMQLLKSMFDKNSSSDDLTEAFTKYLTQRANDSEEWRKKQEAWQVEKKEELAARHKEKMELLKSVLDCVNNENSTDNVCDI